MDKRAGVSAPRVQADVQGWVQAILEAKWIRDEHLTNPDGGAGAEATLRLMHGATYWEELDLPSRVLMFNTQFQLLATLDLEFCAFYLPHWEATPIFLSLLPCLAPRVAITSGSTIAATRDLFHYPTRRLLDIVACMRTMRESPGRNGHIRCLRLRGCYEVPQIN